MRDRTDFWTRDRVLNTTQHLFIMVGLPRTGKSTWVNENHDRGCVLSGDDLRRAMGHQYNPRAQPMLRVVHHYAVEAMLLRGQSVIVDDCHLTIERRQRWIDIGCRTGALPVIVEVAQPIDIEAHKRACREDDFPWHVIEELKATYQPVTRAEKVAARHTVVPNRIDLIGGPSE